MTDVLLILMTLFFAFILYAAALAPSISTRWAMRGTALLWLGIIIAIAADHYTS